MEKPNHSSFSRNYFNFWIDDAAIKISVLFGADVSKGESMMPGFCEKEQRN